MRTTHQMSITLTQQNGGVRSREGRHVDAIVDFSVRLQTFAARGVPRDDLLPALRITHFRKRAIIAYLLDEEIVSVVGVF